MSSLRVVSLLPCAFTFLIAACGVFRGNDYTRDKTLGDHASMDVALTMGIANDPERFRYLNQVGQRLARQIPETPVTFRFNIIDNSEMNAFSLPGGYVYVTRGILAAASSEDELAAILAHEMAHVTERHSVRQVKRERPARLLQVPGNIAGAVLGDGMGGLINSPATLISGLNLARYSRRHERVADTIGISLMARAGYDPRAMAAIVGKLAAIDAAEGAQAEKRSFFHSHPYTPDRVSDNRETAARIKFAPQPPIAPDYLRKIDGLTYGEDPSQGLLRGQVFQSPRNNFAINFPTGWESFQSGGGVLSANGVGDALIAIMPTTTSERPEAMGRKFVTALGDRFVMPPYQARRANELGFESYVVTLRDTSGPRPSYLHLLWIRTGRETALILGMGEDSHRPELRAAAKSIRQLTPTERRAFQVDAVSSAPSRAGESLESFNRRTGNLWSPQVTAAMNDMELGASLPARRMKLLRRRALR